MKLFIVRSQSKGLLGGVKFELKAKVELADREAELVRKYSVEEETLLKTDVKIPLTGRALVFNLTIRSLMNGQNFKCNDIAEILETENNVKEACEAFKNYIEVMDSFGGEEVIEY